MPCSSGFFVQAWTIRRSCPRYLLPHIPTSPGLPIPSRTASSPVLGGLVLC
jgi:hypothetical protein